MIIAQNCWKWKGFRSKIWRKRKKKSFCRFRWSGVARQAHALELRIVGDLDNIRIFQCRNHFFWKRFTAGKVNSLYRLIVEGIGEQKNLEIRRVALAVHAASGQRRRAVGFNIDAHEDGHMNHSHQKGAPFRMRRGLFTSEPGRDHPSLHGCWVNDDDFLIALIGVFHGVSRAAGRRTVIER